MKFFSLILLTVMLLLPQAGEAQSLNAHFVTRLSLGAGLNGRDRLSTTVHLRPSADIDLGTSTLMFTYNTDGLVVPSGASGNDLLVPGVDYDMIAPFDSLGSAGVYDKSTVTVFGSSGRISINMVLDSTSAGAVITPNGASIVTVYLDVISDIETSQLSWIPSTQPNGTVVNRDDNITVVANGLLIDRDELLDIQLPVELASFEGVSEKQSAVLIWSTTRETNVSAFEVQHQDLQVLDWETDGVVAPLGVESGERTYRHQTDALPFGLHRFRLRVVGTDGVESYSEETEVRVFMDVPYVIGNVYPNPVGRRATLPIAVRIPQRVRITALDILGRSAGVLFDGQLTANESHRIPIRTGSLAAGTYLLIVQGDNLRVSRRIAVVR